LINIYKFTKETLARRFSFDRFSTSLIICCFHILVYILFVILNIYYII